MRKLEWQLPTACRKSRSPATTAARPMQSRDCSRRVQTSGSLPATRCSQSSTAERSGPSRKPQEGLGAVGCAIPQRGFDRIPERRRRLARTSGGRRALAAATAAEQAASRSFDLVRRQLEQGQVSLPILLNAQQAYLQTSLARVQAEAARLSDIVALFQALGGGWWNRWEATIMPPD